MPEKKGMQKKVTLQAVFLLALDDRKFLNALLRDPETALSRAKLKLSPRDLIKLKRMLRSRKWKNLNKMLARKYTILGSDLLRILLTGMPVPLARQPWPPPPWLT